MRLSAAIRNSPYQASWTGPRSTPWNTRVPKATKWTEIQLGAALETGFGRVILLDVQVRDGTFFCHSAAICKKGDRHYPRDAFLFVILICPTLKHSCSILLARLFFYLCHCRSFPFHLFHSSWLKFIVVCTIVYACSLVNYWSISTLFRGPMRGPFERQGWIHRSVQLQREIRVRILGHLSLQSRFHFVGQCLEALLWRRGVDWNKAPLQAN